MLNLDTFKQEISEYGESRQDTPTKFELKTCSCGNNLFFMYSDDVEGGCGIVCTQCDEGFSIEDSADYMEDVAHNTCSCGVEELHVMVAKSYYTDTVQIKWVYVGGMCPG